MRGKEDGVICQMNLHRITPAHAGKSFIDKVGKTIVENHPRTCGEKLTKNPNTVTLPGSPPHMRGKGYAVAEQP